MNKNLQDTFKHFLKVNGVRQLFEGYMKSYGHGNNIKDYLEELDDPIYAVAHAFEYDKVPKGAIDFKAMSEKWERLCINNRYDQKINALLDTYGQNETYKAIEQYKKEGKFYLYSMDYLTEKQKQEDEKKLVKAHLVSHTPKKAVTIADSGDDFEFVTFNTKSNPTDLSENEIIIKNGTHEKYIKFNTHISGLVKEYDLNFFRVRLDKITGDVHIIIQSEETKDSVRINATRAKNYVYLSNKAVVEWLIAKFKLSGEEISLPVTKNLSRNLDVCVTIKIMK